MENTIPPTHSSKAPRGALEKKCARKAVDLPAAKRTKHTKEENTEHHGAGVNFCVPPTKVQSTELVPLTQANVGEEFTFEAITDDRGAVIGTLLKGPTSGPGAELVRLADGGYAPAWCCARRTGPTQAQVDAEDAYKVFRPHLKHAHKYLLQRIAADIADRQNGRALVPDSDDDEDDDELERVALEIRLNVDSENVKFVLSSKKTDIYVLVDGKPKTKRSKKLPSVYASVLAPLMDKGLATLEFKSIGCPGYIHVEVVGTKLQPVLPPSVGELESAWED